MNDRKYLLKRQNPNNKLLTCEVIETIMAENGLHLKVNNLEIYQQAFVHRSYLRTANSEEVDESCVPLQDSCNETYEFLGDTILNSVVGTYLYDRYNHENEGFLTKTRTKMVRGTTLGELAKRLGFGEWIIISQHVENEGGRENVRILEDLFEAFLGAIYLDNGSEVIDGNWSANYLKYQDLLNNKSIDTLDHNDLLNYVHSLIHTVSNLLSSRSNGYLYCQRFVRNTYERHIDIVKLIQYDDNYKDQLQTYFQKQNDVFPKWEVLRGGGENKGNHRMHTIGIRDRCGFLIGTGKDRKKTDAEQQASRNALIYLGVIDENHGVNFFK